MRRTRSTSRASWVKKVLGPKKRFTANQMKQAVNQLLFKGWTSAMPPEGPVDEEFAVVHQDHALFDFVEQVRACNYSASREAIERALGQDLASTAGAVVLPQCGLAVVTCQGDRLVIHAANRHAARYINLARIGPSSRGFTARYLIEAFARPKRPGRSRINLSDDLRLNAAAVLEEWRIDADDLLSCRDRIRLISRWIYAPKGNSQQSQGDGNQNA